MGVEILEYTTKEPITMIGKMAGICYNANTTSPEKNYKRGLDCIISDHGRTLEFPQIYMKISGYSAKCIREFGRHIGGMPTYLQASTRYINYEEFGFVTPPKIKNNQKAEEIYNNAIEYVRDSIIKLNDLGIENEDSSMLLPLGMNTIVVHRTNLRNLIDMSHVRECSRAFWEFRELFKDIKIALSEYSTEWSYLINELKVFKPKCELYGYCNEKKSCGRKPKRQLNG